MGIAHVTTAIVVAVTTIAVALVCRLAPVGVLLRVAGTVLVVLMAGIGLTAMTYASDSAAARRGAAEFLAAYGGVVFLAELVWLTVGVLTMMFRRGDDRTG